MFTASADYTTVIEEVVFEPQEILKEVQVPVVQDSVAEGPEMFTATLVANEDLVTIHGVGLATIVIEDDDSEHISLMSLYLIQYRAASYMFYTFLL